MNTKMKNVFATLSLLHGSLFDNKQTSDRLEKTKDVLINKVADEESSNIEALLDELESRSDGIRVWSLDKRVPSNKWEQLKRHLKNNSKNSISWHLYDDADLWTALKNYLRHLQSCPLGSDSYLKWSRIQWDYFDNDRIERIQNLLKKLSVAELFLVKTLFRILNRMAKNPAQPELDALELSARLGPYLLWDVGRPPRRSTAEGVNVQTLWISDVEKKQTLKNQLRIA